MGLFKKKKINFEKLPAHIAFIMDGNGRWAKKRGMLRTYGHKIGVKSMIAIVDHAKKLGVKVVSFYAFSTENWSRPKEEVDEIFALTRDLIRDKKEDYIKAGIKLKVIGDITRLPQDLQKEIVECEAKTKDNKEFIVNVALNYGSRSEIINAVNQIIKDKVPSVDEQIFKKYLQTQDILDPDLVVRTSGENRLSNFMLYQCAYSELYFPKTFWPDFREKQLEEAIIEYQGRFRRFGGLKNK